MYVVRTACVCLFLFYVGPVCLFVTVLGPSVLFDVILSTRIYFLYDCMGLCLFLWR